MGLEDIQTKIRYQFANLARLRLALRAAHRGDFPPEVDEGNRGIGDMGAKILNMVETYDIVWSGNGTKRDANTRKSWTRSKREQANACRCLEFDRYITRSARQGNETPSVNVLAMTICAIIGAMWLDMEEREFSISEAMVQMTATLRYIEESIPVGEAFLISETLGHGSGTHAGIAQQRPALTSRQMEVEVLPGIPTSINTPHESSTSSYISPGSCRVTEASHLFTNRKAVVSPEIVQSELEWMVAGLTVMTLIDISHRISAQIPATDVIPISPTERVRTNPKDIPVDSGPVRRTASQPDQNTKLMPVEPVQPQPSIKDLKRKFSTTSDETVAIQLEIMISEEAGKLNGRAEKALLRHDHVVQMSLGTTHLTPLQILYFSIGSSQSLINFKEILETVRSGSVNPLNDLHRNMSPEQTYSAIRSLHKTSALSTLLRRYLVVKLISDESSAVVMHIVTPSNFEIARMRPGNAANKIKSDVTDAMMQRLIPGITKDTNEYRKARREVSTLRRLGTPLRALKDRFGYGILPLLSLGTSFMDIDVTDDMQVQVKVELAHTHTDRLRSIPEELFLQFLQVLQRHQGDLLRFLSKYVEPALDALVQGKLHTCNLFEIEQIDMHTIESLPKGAVEIYCQELPD